jgi:hypothetical protein
MIGARDRARAGLSAFFFAGMFDLGFLSEVATASFTRLVIGVCTAFFSFGLLLTRVYGAKYVALADMASPEPYRHAVLVDQVFLLSLPMWIVAFVTVLVGHALFPDEQDLRVLGPLPISRALVFQAKALSMFRFVGLFIVSLEVAIAPLLITMSVSKWAEGLFVARAAAAAAAVALGCAFCVLAIGAWQGVMRLCATRSRTADVAAVARSGMLCALMTCLPFIGRLPAQAPQSLIDGQAWWWMVPPAWFLGLERWMLGDDRLVMRALAGTAIAALVVVALIAAASYALLYRHFERLTLRTQSAPRTSARQEQTAQSKRPVFDGIRRFVLVTLRRSSLHQSVAVVVGAVGAGLALNSVIGQDITGGIASRTYPPAAVTAALLWAPFAFIYAGGRALRLAFLLPLEPRANWIFRLAEDETLRLEQAEAATRSVFVFGAVVPIAILAPLQVALLGVQAVAAAGTTALWAYLYVELLMKDWTRVPFTCSYIPGKRFLPQRLLIGSALFVTFTLGGEALAWGTLQLQPLSLAANIGLLAGALAIRGHRRHFSRLTPLQFEDALPTELFPLKLGPP